MNKIIKVALVVLLISIISIVGVGCVVDKNNTGDKDNTDDKGNTGGSGGEKENNPVNPPYVAEGDFYNMQAAYDAGILTVEDLQSIAYYYNGKSDIDGFVPKPQVPAELSNEIMNTIKREYRDKLDIPPSLIEAHPDGIHIDKYYGSYNGAIVIMIRDSYIPKDIIFIDYNVAGVMFYHYGGGILVWKSLK